MGVTEKSKQQESLLVLGPPVKINFRGSWIIVGEHNLIWETLKIQVRLQRKIMFYGAKNTGLGDWDHVPWDGLFNNL